MLATSVSAPCARIQAHRQRHTSCPRDSPALRHKPLFRRFEPFRVQQPRNRRHVAEAGFFFGGLGCLPLLIFAPFLAAIFAVWSILATIQFIIVSTFLLARSAAKAFFSAGDGDADGSKERGGKRRSNTIIDIEPDPEVKQGYDDLDDELKRFDEDLRRRRR